MIFVDPPIPIAEDAPSIMELVKYSQRSKDWTCLPAFDAAAAREFIQRRRPGVIEPCSPRDLIARTKALLRRTHPAAERSIVRVAYLGLNPIYLVLNPMSYSARIDEKPIALEQHVGVRRGASSGSTVPGIHHTRLRSPFPVFVYSQFR